MDLDGAVDLGGLQVAAAGERGADLLDDVHEDLLARLAVAAAGVQDGLDHARGAAAHAGEQLALRLLCMRRAVARVVHAQVTRSVSACSFTMYPPDPPKGRNKPACMIHVSK